jgi:beta-phosphoglucomutase
MYGAIFDMDGVLFPTEELKFKAYHEVFEREYGVNLRDTEKRLGLSETKAMELFLEIYGHSADFAKIPKLVQWKRQAYYQIIEKDNFQPYPGVEDFLKEFKNSKEFKIALATSSNRKSAEILLKHFNFMDYFDIVLSLEDVKNPKPNPEIYFLASERLGTKPEFCVVFEDSLVGLAAAKSAGMKCVAITTGVPSERLSKADLVVRSFNQVSIDIIRQLLK